MQAQDTTITNSRWVPAEMPLRRLARITGLLWILTFATSITAVVLYGPLLDDPGFILGDGGSARILIGAALELLLIIANLGTALVPYALYRRYDERLALGFVAARVMESAFIAVGILSVVAYMTVRQDPGSASDGSLLAVGHSFVALHDATFLLGPGFVVGIGNGLIFGLLMYRSGLLPRRMAILALVAGPILCASGLAVLLGAFDAGSVPQFLATIPEIVWEAFIGLYLTFKGFSTPVAERAASPAVAGGAGLAVAPA